MPELPEVETIVRKLNVLVGQTLQSVTQLHPKSIQGDISVLINQPILSVSRRAKIIRLRFPQNQNVLIHLKMTGQLIYLDDQVRLGGGHPTADWVSELPSKHTRAVLTFISQARLFFNDQRLFGWLKVQTDEEAAAYFAKLGPDVVDPEFTVEYLSKQLHRRRQAIKVVMMDNAVVCGLGNIYVCDTLNVAKINPLRPAASLSPEEVARLWQSARSVITQGIELGGTTFDGKYVDTAGFAGSYQTAVRVYGRDGQPCYNCGGTIKKIRQAGRSTYYCPSCQV